MPTGLVALLDDIAGIAKLAASPLDDVGAAAGKASSKAAGVVIDDAAVTPRYVVGLTPDRELPIIAKIAKGSLRNKLLFLLPAALALSAFAPWALTPCLMAGGAYLCFEAAEKIFEALWEHHDQEAEAIETLTSAEIEKEKVGGAIRTDFILSGEIMAISLASVADKPLVEQAVVLAIVAVLITVGVYGVVGFIVKMDDIGLGIARGSSRLARGLGRGLVHAMPLLMRALSIIGTAAMLWVGGGIIVHGMEEFGLTSLPHLIHHLADAAASAVPPIGPVIDWAINAIGAGIVGLMVGGVITALFLAIRRKRTA